MRYSVQFQIIPALRRSFPVHEPESAALPDSGRGGFRITCRISEDSPQASLDTTTRLGLLARWRFNPFQNPCKIVAGNLRSRLGTQAIYSTTTVRSENRSKSCFIAGCRSKKLPNSNPRAESAQTLLFSSNFALFPDIPRCQTYL